MKALIARKVGMTHVFDENDELVPVTVIHVAPNTVLARKTEEKSGYDAVVLGVGEKKPKHVNKAFAGQFSGDLTPKKLLKEVRDFDAKVNVGDVLGVDFLADLTYLDVTAVSKGKGFQGVFKRYGFHGGRASHGSKFHREPGSTGQSTTPGHSFKNVKMPGRMGTDKVTVQNLRVVKIDPELSVVLVRGAVPGTKNSPLLIKAAIKK
ncbi:MAG: 50S ribosomal protein L3 [Treponemataceae bacterium]|nr:MAG: 50S ribosomal protein L3 [Treponemataceae bacterium]